MIVLAYVSRILILAGSISGVCGAILMANQYTRAVDRIFDLAEVLLNALARGNKAKGMVAVSADEPEHRIVTLQGLGFVFLGFLLQAAGVMLELFTFR
jgi:hypothetical protein